MVYVEKAFYLLTEDVQKHPNCFTTKATPCRYFIDVHRQTSAAVDKYGFATAGNENRIFPIIENFPAVLEASGTVEDGKNQAGAYVGETIVVKLQRNCPTDAIRAKDILTIQENPGEYEVVDVRIEGNKSGCPGIVILTAQKKP